MILPLKLMVLGRPQVTVDLSDAADVRRAITEIKVAICIKNDEFFIKNDGVCISNDEFNAKGQAERSAAARAGACFIDQWRFFDRK